MHFSLIKHLLLKEMNTGNEKTKMKKNDLQVLLYREGSYFHFAPSLY